MKEEPARMQLRLTLAVQGLVKVPAEVERQLVAALADLLVMVARRSDAGREGGADEREDP